MTEQVTPPSASLFALEDFARRKLVPPSTAPAQDVEPTIKTSCISSALDVAQPSSQVPAQTTVQTVSGADFPPGFNPSPAAPGHHQQPIGSGMADAVAPKAAPTPMPNFGFASASAVTSERQQDEVASATASRAAKIMSFLKHGRKGKPASDKIIPAPNDGIQINPAPLAIVAVLVAIGGLVGWSIYRQSNAEQIVQASATDARQAAQKTADTLGAGFAAATSMPITTATSPVVAPVAAPSSALPLAGSADERARIMLAEIESGNRANTNYMQTPKVTPPSRTSPSTPPAAAAAETTIKTSPAPKKIPSYIEGEVFDEVSRPQAPTPPPPLALFADLAVANASVPYRMVSASVDDGLRQALILDIPSNTAAWIKEGDVLVGGYTVVTINRASVVVKGPNNRLSTLRGG